MSDLPDFNGDAPYASPEAFQSFPDPRLSLEASLRRCFPHRGVKVYSGMHGATTVAFSQGYTRHVIDVVTPTTHRPNEMRALVVEVGGRMLEVLFPKGRYTA